MAILIFTIVLTAVIYPIQASWKWGGGFLDAMGFLDFAGSTVVHSVGGWAALMGALILGPRIGKYAKDGRVIPMQSSNLPLATLGTFVCGWVGLVSMAVHNWQWDQLAMLLISLVSLLIQTRLLRVVRLWR